MAVVVELTEPAGKFQVESEFYRVCFERGAGVHCGAMDFVVKQGENANKVTDGSNRLQRPFTLMFEEATAYYFSPKQELGAVESSGLRCVLGSSGGAFAGVNNSRSTFNSFSADVRVAAYRDRFLMRYVWRNGSPTPVVVYSNMHMWWYSNGFYQRSTVLKDSTRRAAYDGGTCDWAMCVWLWNEFAEPHGVVDDVNAGRLAHWLRDGDLPAVGSGDGDFAQVIAVFVQPPGSSTELTDLRGKIDDYHFPDVPAMEAGERMTGSAGDDDGDGFNESEGAYHFACVGSRVKFGLDVERGGATARAFYYPVFVLHGYEGAGAPVLRLNGVLLDGESGGRHGGGSHEGASYASVVLPGNVGLVWCGLVLSEDCVVEAAECFGSRRLVGVGAGRMRG